MTGESSKAEFGPEEMVPKTLPPSGSDGYPLFSLYAESFYKQGFHTLQLGKPGVEYFSTWERFLGGTNFYDKALWSSLRWEDLLTNVEAAITRLKADPQVDPNRIYLLGHSEGTMVVSDVAARHPEIRGVILLGYMGENVTQFLRWQLLERQMEMVISPDIDANHDGFLTEVEAAPWPIDSFLPPQYLADHGSWDWKARPKLALTEIQNLFYSDALLQDGIKKVWLRFPFWKDLTNRQDMKQTTASIRGSVHLLTGEMDVNTPPPLAFALKQVCRQQRKFCSVHIVPKLSHLFMPLNSKPKGPKFNRVLDQGMNPVDEGFLRSLEGLARKL